MQARNDRRMQGRARNAGEMRKRECAAQERMRCECAREIMYCENAARSVLLEPLLKHALREHALLKTGCSPISARPTSNRWLKRLSIRPLELAFASFSPPCSHMCMAHMCMAHITCAWLTPCLFVCVFAANVRSSAKPHIVSAPTPPPASISLRVRSGDTTI